MKRIIRQLSDKYFVGKTTIIGFIIVIVFSALIALVALFLIGRIQQANRLLYNNVVNSMLPMAELNNQIYERKYYFEGYLSRGKDIHLVQITSDSIDYLLESQISNLEPLQRGEFTEIISALRSTRTLNAEYMELAGALALSGVSEQSIIDNISYLDGMITHSVLNIYVSLTDLGDEFFSTVDQSTHLSRIILVIMAMASFIAGLSIMWIVGTLIKVNDKQQEKALEQERTRLEAERLLAETQLNMLQAQINPHFLFNALNVVARTSLLEGATKSEQLTYSLANILRYSLRHVGESVPLEDELKCIKEYFNIHKVRFGDGVQLEVEVPDDALKYLIPVFTLQPLVENAIVHGLEPRGMTGAISIEAGYKDRWLMLAVKDNGVGMNSEMLNDVLHNTKLAGSGKGQVTGLGLTNVISRVKQAFGENAHVEIVSRSNQGTEITFWLPLST